MLRALYAGVSGLRGHETLVDIIGNNIANVNTVGFKAGRMNFADIFNQTISGASNSGATQGGTNPRQVGLGASIDSIDTIFTQGNLNTTDRLLDMAIEGQGFFRLADATGQSVFLTRAGNFSQDDQGYLTAPGSGLRVTGFNASIDGTIDDTQPPSAIQIDYSREAQAIVTHNATFSGNLNSTSDPSPASGASSALAWFDRNGTAVNLHCGDVIQFASGTAGSNDLTGKDVITIGEGTTLDNIAAKLQDVLRQNADNSPAISVTVNSDGSFKFSTDAAHALSNLTVDVKGASNATLRNIFIDAGDPKYLMSLNVADGSTCSETTRQADATTSINTYDSQGNARNLRVAYARDTGRLTAAGSTLLSGLVDAQGRSLGLATGTGISLKASGTITDTTGNVVDLSTLVNDPTNLRKIMTVGATDTLDTLATDIQTALNKTGMGGAGAVTGVTVNDDGSLNIQMASGAKLTGLSLTITGETAGTTSPFDAAMCNCAGGLTTTAGGTATTRLLQQDQLPMLNQWNWHALVPYTTTHPRNDTGTIIFDSTGQFQGYADSGTTDPVLKFDPDGTGSQNDGVDELSIALNMRSLVQNSSASTVALSHQDGRPVGTLNSVNIDNNGVITGVFSNGANLKLAQMVLCTVTNEDGLTKVGDSMYSESPNSGTAVYGKANEGGRGSIHSGTLELSNVDLTKEFTDLIVAQRGFQANSRLITTTDDMLNELVNMKR